MTDAKATPITNAIASWMMLPFVMKLVKSFRMLVGSPLPLFWALE
ncbi:MAG: hypothetical protein WCB18_10070 [Thermoplasmata archaeon]